MRAKLEYLTIGLLLAAILSPLAMLYRKEQARRELRACCTNLKSIGAALEAYSTDYAGRYPGNGGYYSEDVPLTRLAPYLEKLPTCPTGSPYVLATGV